MAKAGSVTINDVFIAVAAGGLRSYLGELDELPAKSLIVGAPVSVRVDDGDDRANAIAFIMVKMHTEIADPKQRLKAINRSSSLAKDNLKKLRKGAADQYGLLTNGPFVLQSVLGVAGRLAPPYNFVLSNVPGPRRPPTIPPARRGARCQRESQQRCPLKVEEPNNLRHPMKGGAMVLGVSRSRARRIWCCPTGWRTCGRRRRCSRRYWRAGLGSRAAVSCRSPRSSSGIRRSAASPASRTTGRGSGRRGT